MHRHPLENPSLTPHGFGRGSTEARSKEQSWMGMLNEDWAAARFWQEANRLECAFRPAEHIIHTLMPGLRALGRTRVGDSDFEFAGKPYQSADIATLSSIATWLGTNCGQSMLTRAKHAGTNDFFAIWNKDEKQSGISSLKHLLHVCDPKDCGDSRLEHRFPEPSEREQVVLRAFLFWLRQETGQKYLSGLDEFIRTEQQKVSARYRLKMKRPEVVAA